MKAFVCFAFLAVAAAIPLKDSEQISVPEGPISFEMLRNAAAFPVPVWRDLPINILPEGDVFVAIPIPDAMLRGPINNFPVSNVQVVDAIEAMPSDVASEIVPNSDVVPSQVNVVYAAEPEVLSDDDVPAVASEIIRNSDIVADKVKVVYAPEIEMLSEDNVDVPNVAREIIPNSDIVADKVKVVYTPEIEMLSEDNVDVPNVAREIIPNSDIGADKVHVVYAAEPEVLSEDKLDVPEFTAPEVVKFVDGPIDLKNMKVPIDARDIV